MADKTKNDPAKKETLKVKIFQKQGWTTIGIVVAVLAIIGLGVGAGGYVIHLSDTSPEFCGICHVMDKNVKSYLSSNNMDRVHAQANVQCKDCHDYPLSAEISSGINYIIGNYSVNAKGELMPVTFGDEMCLKCHISDDHLAKATDFLHRNPHKNHNGELDCKVCHISHGKQINYCGTCHDNGGQRMTGEENISRRSTIR
jgi:nitrate/TMAO reductase-like tetraheme cytochrome c subunit